MELTRFGRLAETNWVKQRPKMCAALKRQGMWLPALQECQQRMEDSLVDMISDRGVNPQVAMELALHQFINLPSEQEVPELGPDRMPFSQSNLSSKKTTR